MNNEFGEMRAEIDRIASSTKFNSISMLNSAGNTISIHVGELSTDKIDVVTSKINSASNGLNISGIDISGVNSALTALGRLETAIGLKDAARANFGYKMNRLESTVAVIGVQAENLLAAESRISDVDVATEMAAMTRNQVLAQAGVAMLAQANSLPQMALTLLR
jgi:flagellin